MTLVTPAPGRLPSCVARGSRADRPAGHDPALLPSREDGVPPSSASAPVLVTGGAGYIGSRVVTRLLEAGRHARVFDSMMFGDRALTRHRGDPALEVVVGDVRDVAAFSAAVQGTDSVLHLAGLVGDPACGLDPALTQAVNIDSTRTLAELCSRHAVRRLVFASTCSVYGAAGDEWLDETSPTAPVSLYAESNLESEQLFASLLAGTGVELATLRFATVFGVSERMRFDLVVNLLTARAIKRGALEVHGGAQWRPQVHVDDVATALLLAADHPRAAGRTYNVGSDALNLRVEALAGLIAERFPGTLLTVSDTVDARSYRVSFAHIADELGFVARHSVADGVDEIAGWLAAHPDANPDAALYSNVRTLEAVLR
jgi:nucleoside-diphosphate-sugar epimerase